MTSIGRMLKSSFPFCESDQIAMSSHNVQTSHFRFFRRDAAIWVDTINKILKMNNKVYIMEENSHTWIKYTCRMCKVCLFISFLPDFSMSSKNVQYGKNVTLLFLYHCHLHNVSKLTCYAARRNIVRNGYTKYMVHVYDTTTDL
jgi:predicted component of viral defense system (DUF524 family)